VSVMAGAQAGALQSTEVQSTGTGVTLQQAIDNGLLIAVEQVNGKTVSEADLSATVDLSAHLRNDANYLNSSAYIEVMQQATHGAVTGFKVVSSKQDASGNWTAALSVSVSKYVRSAAENRVRIAVAAPRTLTSTYSVFGSRVEAAQVSGDFADNMQMYLTETNKFTVLDRKYDDEAAAERGIAASGEASTEEYALLGQKLVADYVLVGTIDSLAFRISETKSHTGDHVYKEPVGEIAFSYRLINTATQQVVYAGSTEYKAADFVGSNSESPAGTAFVSLIAKTIAPKVASAVTQSIYPIRVLSDDGNQVIVGAGEGVLKQGVVYKIVSYGREITDPDTKESLGHGETYCCELRIDRVTPRLSYASLVAPTSTLPSFTPSTYVLSQEVSPGAANAPIRAKAAKSAVDAEKKKQQQANSSDWAPP
jgi:hypothetical protein